MRNAIRLGFLIGGLGAGLVLADGARADDDVCNGPISRAQAVEIARSVGLVRVEEVDCDDDEWEVEGRDAQGREIEVEIDVRTGRIKEVERD